MRRNTKKLNVILLLLAIAIFSFTICMVGVIIKDNFNGILWYSAGVTACALAIIVSMFKD